VLYTREAAVVFLEVKIGVAVTAAGAVVCSRSSSCRVGRAQMVRQNSRRRIISKKVVKNSTSCYHSL